MFVAEQLDQFGISWNRPLRGHRYEWNGSRLYYPDFYLPSYDLFIEVKGFQRDRDLAKWSVIEKLLVIKQKEIDEMRDGAIDIRTLVEDKTKWFWADSSIGRTVTS